MFDGKKIHFRLHFLFAFGHLQPAMLKTVLHIYALPRELKCMLQPLVLNSLSVHSVVQCAFKGVMLNTAFIQW